MKCPNCGFENNFKYCKMCGNKMPDYSDSSYDCKISYKNNTVNSQNVFTPQNHCQKNPLQYSQPDFNINLNTDHTKENEVNLQKTLPTVPAFKNELQKTGTKKPAAIIISVLIIAVIIAGVIINIFSACSYNESFKEQYYDLKYYDLSGMQSDYYNPVSPLYVSPSYNETNAYNYTDPEKHQKGDTVVLMGSEITLIDYSVKDFNNSFYNDSPYYSDCKNLEAVFEVKNTADDNLYLEISQFSISPIDSESFDYCCEVFAMDGDSEKYGFSVKPGVTKKFSISFAVQNDISAAEIMYNDTNGHEIDFSDNSNQTAYSTCYYKVDIK